MLAVKVCVKNDLNWLADSPSNAPGKLPRASSLDLIHEWILFEAATFDFLVYIFLRPWGLRERPGKE
jgi:hypothetical protein